MGPRLHENVRRQRGKNSGQAGRRGPGGHACPAGRERRRARRRRGAGGGVSAPRARARAGHQPTGVRAFFSDRGACGTCPCRARVRRHELEVLRARRDLLARLAAEQRVEQVDRRLVRRLGSRGASSAGPRTCAARAERARGRARGRRIARARFSPARRAGGGGGEERAATVAAGGARREGARARARSATMATCARTRRARGARTEGRGCTGGRPPATTSRACRSRRPRARPSWLRARARSVGTRRPWSRARAAPSERRRRRQRRRARWSNGFLRAAWPVGDLGTSETTLRGRRAPGGDMAITRRARARQVRMGRLPRSVLSKRRREKIPQSA